MLCARVLTATLAVLCLALAAPRQAVAGGLIISELRAGFDLHNIDGAEGENGFDTVLEVYFAKPDWRFPDPMLQHVLRPRTFIGFSANDAGDTNELFAGFAWQMQLSDSAFLETSFGGAVHDGPLDDPTYASFGCRANFRESAGLGFKLTPHWQLLTEINHMSNANLCGRNRGLTNAGVRLGYVFD